MIEYTAQSQGHGRKAKNTIIVYRSEAGALQTLMVPQKVEHCNSELAGALYGQGNTQRASSSCRVDEEQGTKKRRQKVLLQRARE